MNMTVTQGIAVIGGAVLALEAAALSPAIDSLNAEGQQFVVDSEGVGNSEGLMVAQAGGSGDDSGLEEHMRSHALRYASMIERAYGRLHGHIRNRSTAAATWSGAAIPPAGTGWDAVWTAAGVRARYCDDVLVVYIAPDALKGVGDQHRAIQQARRNYLAQRESGVRLPMLSWLESGTVTDSQGNARVLPACMTSSYTAPLPSGRAALSGDVVDPWTDVRERATFETRESACPAGQHGEVRERREITEDFNAKGDVIPGTRVEGAWVAAPGSWCRADYTYNEIFTRECSWNQGPPFNREMTGTETWRIPVAVTADRAAEAETPPRYGVVQRTPGTPVFVSTTCWDGPPPTPPVPTSTVTTETETRTLSCGTGFTGSITESRTKTTATTTYPWGEAQLVSIEYTNWSETANTCTAVCPPPCNGGPDGDGPDGDAPDDAPDDTGRDRGSNMGPDAICGCDPNGNNSDGNSGNDGNDGVGDFGGDGSAFCFSATAKVALAGGGWREAGRVVLGDRLLSPEGPVQVLAVYRDLREKWWVSVNGGDPYFTATHPVVTARGTVAGGAVLAGDRLRGLEGGWEAVRTVERRRERRVSINIETAGHAPFFVEGVLFGSYSIEDRGDE